MTVSTQTARKQYDANGVLDTFAYDFLILASSDLKVYVDDALQSEGASGDYTVTGVGVGTGGNVVFNAGSIPANGTVVTLVRSTPFTQATDYVDNTKFSAASHENAMDKLTLLIQQVNEIIRRAAILNIYSEYEDLTLPDPEDGYFLQWKSDLSGLQNAVALDASEVSITSLGEQILASATADNTRGIIGIGGGRCLVNRNGSAQTGIVTGTPTKIQFTNDSSGEAFDQDGLFDPTTNYRWTAAEAGYYLVGLSVGIVDLADAKYVKAMIYKDGANIASQKVYSSVADGDPVANVMQIVYFAVGEYVEGWIEHDHGSNRSASGATDETFMNVVRVS